jgi:hypothetical protein
VRGEAQVKVAESELALQRELLAAGAAGERQITLAEAKVASAQADLAILRADAALAAAEAQKAQARLERARGEAKLRIDDKRRVDVAKHDVEVAQARVAAAKTSSDEAKLRLDRMEVRAPAAGIVLERLAAPGTTLAGGEARFAGVHLVRSDHLRVRVDVPQGEIAKASAGQRAEITAESSHGQALPRPRDPRRAEGRHPEGDASSARLDRGRRRVAAAEMLAQCASSRAARPAGELDRRAARADPSRLVQNGSVVGRRRRDAHRRQAHGRPRRRAGRVGVEVASGVNVSDKLIDGGRDGLSEGARVHVRGSADMAFIELRDVTQHVHKGETRSRRSRTSRSTIERGEFCVLLGPSGTARPRCST